MQFPGRWPAGLYVGGNRLLINARYQGLGVRLLAGYGSEDIITLNPDQNRNCLALTGIKRPLIQSQFAQAPFRKISLGEKLLDCRLYHEAGQTGFEQNQYA